MSRRFLCSLVPLALALLLHALPIGASEPPGQEKYAGFDIAKLAEATAQLTTLRTQHGEKDGAAAFADWLRRQGLSRAGYDQAFAAWWERFRADPTGQLEARFHRINSEWTQQLNFADAPDRRQETREGVTLDTYARIAVELTRLPGAKLEDVLRRHGVKDAGQWQKVNEAWGKAMKDDTSFALVQQYAALYQKYAGPQFVAEQDATTANLLAANGRRADTAPSPRPVPETLDEVATRMLAASGRDRLNAAREYAHACDLWSGPARRDPHDPRASRCAQPRLERDLRPVILEGLERADDETIGYAVHVAGYLGELEIEDASGKLTVERVLRRAEERLAQLEASFAPIRDKAVPERMPLRAKIDEYTAAVRDLRALLAGW